MTSSAAAWRKLHIGLEPESGELVAWDLTSRDVADVTVLPDLLNQAEGRIETFLAEAAYDGDPTYQRLIQRPQGLPSPRVVIPRDGPRRPKLRTRTISGNEAGRSEALPRTAE